jgi:hypothetical protein
MEDYKGLGRRRPCSFAVFIEGRSAAKIGIECLVYNRDESC